ncbi:MAG: SH3 domain-containing protein [Pseudomonadota bacterium]
MRVWLCALLIAFGGVASAEERGRETGFPIPRYVSLKAKEANIRRGPGFDHRIDWVFQRRGMPLRVVAEYDVWRKVEDIEGEGGWIHATMLSGIRTVILTEEAALLDRPSDRGRAVARVEPQVVARLEGCEGDWCSVAVDDVRGWVPGPSLWGLNPD